MAVLVRTCCCGCDLRTGILLIGIFGLLGSAYGIYAGYNSYKVLTDARDSDKDLPVKDSYFDVVIKLSYAGIGFGAIALLVNLSLLASYALRNRFLAFPWVLWSLFEIVYTFGVTIFMFAIWNGVAYIFFGTILGWILSIYFIIVVFSYIEALREDPSGASAGFPSDTMVTRLFFYK
ncbi:hypothetical protein ACROYT_G044651 [Oculina patagonica]